MTVTLRDVARHAQVSSGTVSRVLNDHAGVNHELRTRVIETARSLGYALPPARPRNASPATEIGFLLVVRDVEEGRARVGQFWADILVGVESTARAAGHRVVFRLLHGLDADGASVLEQVADLRLSAALLVGPAPAETVRALDETGVTLTLVDNVVHGWTGNAVLADDFDGAYQAVEHLHGLGHRNIAFVGGPARPHRPSTNRIYSISRRAQGYRAALDDLGLQFVPGLVEGCDLTPEGGQAAAHRLLAGRASFTAVVAANDPTAVGVLRALADSGRAVPDDVSVVGFDDHPPVLPPRPLTTLCIDTDAIGAVAVRLLNGAMRDPNAPTMTATLPVRLAVRDTTAPPLSR